MWVLLALIPFRAIVNETHTFEVPRWFRNLPAPAGALPATTLLIAAIVLCSTVAVCCARLWWGGRRYRWTGAELGAGLLLIAAVISTWRAGQKHLAVVGVVDFLAVVLYLLTLRQILTRPWHIRLALTVILGTGAMVVTKCAYQRWVEWPQTVEYYEQHKDELIDPASGDADNARSAGLLHDYEQRLRGGSVTGYFGHSNVLGSYLILVVMASLAVAAGRHRRRPGWSLIFPLLIALGGCAAMAYAQSKGAIVACGAALLMWVLGRWIVASDRRFTIRHHLWIAMWLAALVGVAAVLGVLKSNPEALGRSMLFRSMYWHGASEMLRDQGPWGVGANNFGRFFTRYKSVACPEEVESPHSWVVRAATEWGVIGLVGLLVLFVGVSRQIARVGVEHCGSRTADRGSRAADCRSEDRVGEGEAAGLGWGARAEQARAAFEFGGGSIVMWTAGIGAIVVGWTAWILLGSDPGYLAVTLLVAAVPWVFGFIAASMEDNKATVFADDPPGPLLAGICAGLVGFLLHTGIDLAMFRGGAATTFFGMMAISLALREINGGVRSPRPWRGGTPDSEGTSEAVTAPRPRPGALGETPGAFGETLGALGETLGALGETRGALGETLGALGRSQDDGGAAVGRPRRVVAVVVGVGVLACALVLLALLVLPAARLGRCLQEARLNSPPSSWQTYATSRGYRAYISGIACYRLDGTAIEELTDELTGRVARVDQADSVIELVEELRRRDPANSIAWQQLAALRYRRYELGRDPADLDGAIADIRNAVAAYPTSPTKHLMLADLLERQADGSGSVDARLSAAAALQEALDLDAQRRYVSKPHRFSDEMRASIMDRVRRLSADDG
ncbi:MAG: hypothetical protein JXQ75_02965 [Phycisphaerae bacterium]|nr:hypothetical protein [Phycisphaerae bacterium]